MGIGVWSIGELAEKTFEDVVQGLETHAGTMKKVGVGYEEKGELGDTEEEKKGLQLLREWCERRGVNYECEVIS